MSKIAVALGMGSALLAIACSVDSPSTEPAVTSLDGVVVSTPAPDTKTITGSAVLSDGHVAPFRIDVTDRDVDVRLDGLVDAIRIHLTAQTLTVHVGERTMDVLCDASCRARFFDDHDAWGSRALMKEIPSGQAAKEMPSFKHAQRFLSLASAHEPDPRLELVARISAVAGRYARRVAAPSPPTTITASIRPAVQSNAMPAGCTCEGASTVPLAVTHIGSQPGSVGGLSASTSPPLVVATARVPVPSPTAQVALATNCAGVAPTVQVTTTLTTASTFGPGSCPLQFVDDNGITFTGVQGAIIQEYRAWASASAAAGDTPCGPANVAIGTPGLTVDGIATAPGPLGAGAGSSTLDFQVCFYKALRGFLVYGNRSYPYTVEDATIAFGFGP